MNVFELKELLVDIPDDAVVFIDCGHEYSSDLYNVEYNEDYNVVYLD